jgi:hypothetical protein
MSDYISLATSPTLRDEEDDDHEVDWGHRYVRTRERGRAEQAGTQPRISRVGHSSHRTSPPVG